MHARQHYELVSWRRGRPRAQLPALLRGQHAGRRSASRTARSSTTSHVEIRRWFDEGLVDGLRIDHPDGLRDPAAYLDDLAELTGGAYVLVEKILEPGEELPSRPGPPPAPPGTTRSALVDRVLTDPAGAGAARPRSRPGCAAAAVDWHELVHDTKRAVADGILRSEVGRIVRELRRRPPSARRRSATRSPSCWPASRSTAPTCPTAASTSTAAFADARRRRPDLAATLDAARAGARRPGAPARRCASSRPAAR